MDWGAGTTAAVYGGENLEDEGFNEGWGGGVGRGKEGYDWETWMAKYCGKGGRCVDGWFCTYIHMDV